MVIMEESQDEMSFSQVNSERQQTAEEIEEAKEEMLDIPPLTSYKPIETCSVSEHKLVKLPEYHEATAAEE